MVTIKHPGPLMKLAIANRIANLRSHERGYVRDFHAATLANRDALPLDHNDRVYLTYLANEIERQFQLTSPSSGKS